VVSTSCVFVGYLAELLSVCGKSLAEYAKNYDILSPFFEITTLWQSYRP